MKKPEKFDSYIVGGGYNDLLKWVCDYNNGAAHMLSKAIDWYNWKKGDWFYLSDKEFADILEKDERNVRRYKKFLKDKGVLIVKIGMLHGRKTTYYKINVCLIKELITKNRKPKSANAIKKSLEKYREINGCSDDTNTDGHGARMPYDRGQECPMTGGADALCHRAEMSGSTLSYNTSNNTSSSLEAPLPEAQAVPVQQREEEYNKHYGKEQPEESPVQPIEAYVPQAQELPREASNANVSNPADTKVIVDRMIEICKKICPVIRVEEPGKSYFMAYARYKDSFNESLDEWEEYFRRIASSKFLMGERPGKTGNFWELRLTWALSLTTIAEVRRSHYDSDRAVPLTPKQLEAHRQQILFRQKEQILGGIENSNQPEHFKQFRRQFLERFDVRGYYKFNDGGGTSISQKNDTIEIVTQTSEAKEFIEARRGEIGEILISLGINPEFSLRVSWELSREKLLALPLRDTQFTRKLGLKTFPSILEERKFAHGA